MIQGAATAEGTSEYGNRFPEIAYNAFGRTTWKISAAGFGCYRVSAEIDGHAAAMTRPLGMGST
jgi:hypothetical protein